MLSTFEPGFYFEVPQPRWDYTFDILRRIPQAFWNAGLLYMVMQNKMADWTGFASFTILWVALYWFAQVTSYENGWTSFVDNPIPVDDAGRGGLETLAGRYFVLVILSTIVMKLSFFISYGSQRKQRLNWLYGVITNICFVGVFALFGQVSFTRFMMAFPAMRESICEATFVLPSIIGIGIQTALVYCE